MVKNGVQWLVADPANSRIEHAKTDETGGIAVLLPPRSAVLLIGPLPNIKATQPLDDAAPDKL